MPRPLPFKVNGQWYFESVRFVTARKHVHTSNALALCPLCAALYKYARGTTNDAVLESLANVEIEGTRAPSRSRCYSMAGE